MLSKHRRRIHVVRRAQGTNRRAGPPRLVRRDTLQVRRIAGGVRQACKTRKDCVDAWKRLNMRTTTRVMKGVNMRSKHALPAGVKRIYLRWLYGPQRKPRSLPPVDSNLFHDMHRDKCTVAQQLHDTMAAVAAGNTTILDKHITWVIDHLNDPAAAGYDMARALMYKQLDAANRRDLHDIIYSIFSGRRDPTEKCFVRGAITWLWKKKGEDTNPRMYRMLGVPTLIHKLLTGVWLQLFLPLYRRMMDPTQGSFKKGQGSTDWCAVTLHASQAGDHANVPMVAVLADLTQAYDRVPRELIISILKVGLDLPDIMVSIIAGIYVCSGFVDRPTAAAVDETASRSADGRRSVSDATDASFVETFIGLTQGSSCSPVLYNVMTCYVMRSYHATAAGRQRHGFTFHSNVPLPTGAVAGEVWHLELLWYCDDMLALEPTAALAAATVEGIVNHFLQLTGMEVSIDGEAADWQGTIKPIKGKTIYKIWGRDPAHAEAAAATTAARKMRVEQAMQKEAATFTTQHAAAHTVAMKDYHLALAEWEGQSDPAAAEPIAPVAPAMPKKQQNKLRAAARLKAAKTAPIRPVRAAVTVNGVPIPEREMDPYLGLCHAANGNSTHTDFARALTSLWLGYFDHRAMLTSPDLPVSQRVEALYSSVLPKFLFGAVLWSPSYKEWDDIDRVWLKICKITLGWYGLRCTTTTAMSWYSTVLSRSANIIHLYCLRWCVARDRVAYFTFSVKLRGAETITLPYLLRSKPWRCMPWYTRWRGNRTALAATLAWCPQVLAPTGHWLGQLAGTRLYSRLAAGVRG